jgi:dTMP kinase
MIRNKEQTMAVKAAYKGFFITLEGGEGAGKSSLIAYLAQLLKEKDYEVVITREPGGTPLGEMIRHWLLTYQESIYISHQAELLLFLAARAQHIEELIKPSLEAGKVVLCDRFNDSTVAYQGAARDLDFAYVQQLCRLVCGFIQPQLTLFLDVDPEIGLKRTQKLAKEQAASGHFDRIEAQTLQFHRIVQEAFRKIAKQEPDRVLTIDANQPQAAVFKQAVQAIEKRFNVSVR